jgi:hypothetical protein
MAQNNKKQKSKEEIKTETRTTVVIAAIIVLAVACVYYFARIRGATRYDAFATCLTQKQVKMYGLYWCTHCAEQEKLFGASFKRLTYIECGIKGTRDEAPVCKEAGVKNFPTWEFSDGSRKEGTQPLQVLSDKTACRLP